MNKLRFFLSIGILCFACGGYAQTTTAHQSSAVSSTEMNAPEVAIIPQPVSLTRGSGQYTLPETIVIEASNGPDGQAVAPYLRERLIKATGRKVTVGSSSSGAAIRLLLNQQPNATLGQEGYQLSVAPHIITIKANAPAGLFYGVQTLIQLFPKEIESDSVIQNVSWQAPCVEVTDYPRFGWRGLMFDVARHFFTKDQVKDYIDQMVRYKYNLLHLHLTDDQGWRIEIKGLPKLTEVGAWNVKKTGYFGTFSAPTPDEPRNQGGFYTQEDIKELVRYAKERFVNI
jgi:hexosaminidase